MLFHALKTKTNGKYHAGFKPVSLMIDADYADVIVFPAQCSFVAPLGFNHEEQISTVFINGSIASVDDLNSYIEQCKTKGMSVAIESMEDLA